MGLFSIKVNWEQLGKLEKGRSVGTILGSAGPAILQAILGKVHLALCLLSPTKYFTLSTLFFTT